MVDVVPGSTNAMLAVLYGPSNERENPLSDTLSRKRDPSRNTHNMAPMRGATRVIAANTGMNRHARPKTDEYAPLPLSSSEYTAQVTAGSSGSRYAAVANAKTAQKAKETATRLGKVGSTFAKRRGDTWKTQPAGWTNICDKTKGHKRFVKNVPLAGAVDHAAIQQRGMHQQYRPSQEGSAHLTARARANGSVPGTNPYSMETYKTTHLSTDMTNTPNNDRRSNTFGLDPDSVGYTQAMGEAAYRAGNVPKMIGRSGPGRAPAVFEANPDLTAPKSGETAKMVGVFPSNTEASYSKINHWNMKATNPDEPDPFSVHRIASVANPTDRQDRDERTPNQKGFFEYAVQAGPDSKRNRTQTESGDILTAGKQLTQRGCRSSVPTSPK